MRILFVSDIHYSLKQLDWLSAAASGFDVLVIGGDLLDLAGHADLDTQIVVVAKYLGRLGARMPVAVCSGNHDLDAQSESGERTAEWLQHLKLEGVWVDQQGLTVPGCRFSICPWWDGPESREKVAEFLVAEARKDGRPWIWIYHAPPAGAKTSWNGKDYTGDAFLTDLIEKLKPDIVLSGHIHHSPFRSQGNWFDRVDSTWVFNPGRQPSSEPAAIILDLGVMQATWNSEMDHQTICLSTGRAVQSPVLG
jgi:Icc-related predicted phosphoesterase